jgi:hypothetical protein
MKDLYKSLGVNPTASTDEILSRISECGSPTLANDAKSVLLDEEKRRIYNKNFKILREVGRIRQDLDLLDGPAWKVSDSTDFEPPRHRKKRRSGYEKTEYSSFTPQRSSPDLSWVATIIAFAIRFWPITLFAVIGTCDWLEDNFESKPKKKGNSNTTASYRPESTAQSYRNPDSNLRELKLPETGGGYTYFDDEELAGGFLVRTKPGRNHYWIKLEDFFTEETKAEFFIRGGDSFGIEVPTGSYRMKMASGQKWFGVKHRFGAMTEYSKADDLFPIEYGDKWTVDLIPQRNGNLEDTPISADEF